MNSIHPISAIARKLGGLVALFEPGTSFHTEVVKPVVTAVEKAGTRDQLELVLAQMNAKLAQHLMDPSMKELDACMTELASIKGPWPVDAFKEAFFTGLGQELPDDGHAAGRAIEPHRRK